jgi:hypothetical protein
LVLVRPTDTTPDQKEESSVAIKGKGTRNLAVGENFSATTKHERKVISVRFRKLMLTPVTLMVAFFAVAMCNTVAASAATAAPDPAPACTTHLGIPFTTPSEWLSDQSPGVVQDAIPMLFKPAGYRPSDNVAVPKWIKQHSIIAPAVQSFTTTDKGCRDGHIENAYFHVVYAAGTMAGVVLPAQYTTTTVSLTRTKVYTKAITIWTSGIFLGSCGNPLPGARILIKIYVHVTVTVKPKPKPKKHKTVQVKTTKPLPTCAGNIVTVNGQTVCQTQSNSNSTSQSGTTQGQGSPVINNNNTIQVNVQQNQGQQQGQQSCSSNNSSSSSNCSSSTTPPTCTPPQTGTPPNCSTPPPAQSIKITAFPTENDIPTGKSSSQLSITVNASDSGGSLTIDPGNGGVSTCDSSTPQSSVTFSLTTGNNTECYILYAPSDPAQPTSMEVTYSATLGSASDIETQTFGIKYPTRT